MKWVFEKGVRRVRKKLAQCYFKFPTKNNRWLIYVFSEENGRLNKVLDEVCGLASGKGLKFTRPEIRMVCSGIGEIYKVGSTGEVVGKVIGKALEDNLILVFAKYVDGLSDMELAVVVAHEFGHIIDFQTKRQGHPLFESVKHLELDRETFAHAVAAYLYGKIVLLMVAKRCDIPVNENVILRLNLKV